MSQLIACPECKKHLQVPEELMGKKVQCPECKYTFTAEESTPTQVVSARSTTSSKPSSMPSSTAKKKAEWDKDDDDAERTRSRKSKAPTRRRHDDDDDDDDYDRPRRRSRRSRYGVGGYAPHRGGAILAFGIISLASFAVFAPLAIIFGPMAWIMGNADMAEIRAGRMDPTGEGMVQTGRVLGIIATIICVVILLAVFGFCCLIMMASAMQRPHG